MNNFRFRQWSGFLFGFFIVAVFLAGCDQGESPGKQESVPASKEETTEGEKSKPKGHAIGEEINLQKWILLTVTNVEKSKGNEKSKPRGGSEYITVAVKLENIGDKDFRYNTYSFALVDDKGQTFDEDVLATIDIDTYLGQGELKPGETVEGTITFQRPIGEQGLQVKFVSGYADLPTPRIDLQ
ncbi:DUF4352 domain-containing protein [Bacillus sp. FJAT-29814]|uniref:DUF4352 domain-containing protein n=1 Tax=Bacillus sp. FJAT-29814 TaxID=1729688 RepID=UPI000830801F|nr:DUF4352 domain-containing protein [Bacillus sp. FJAT-29814]